MIVVNFVGNSYLHHYRVSFFSFSLSKMTAVYEDFMNKKLFLEGLKLNSNIKKEKSTEPGTNSATFKLSLNEIIVIDDEDDETANSNDSSKQEFSSAGKSKLLFKSKTSTKVSKSFDFTRGLRGRSKKLLLLDFSSPLGRKIDFSTGFGKTSKNRSFAECVNGYEKWCSTDLKNVPDEERKSKTRSGRKGLRSDAKYNFRKRSKKNNGNNNKLSENSELLLHSMKPCSVVLAHVDASDRSKVFKKQCSNKKNAFVDSSNHRAPECRNTSTTYIDVLKEPHSQNHDDDDLLIKGVYSLAPGASPNLPVRLLEVGQNLMKTQTGSVRADHTYSHSSLRPKIHSQTMFSSDFVGRESSNENDSRCRRDSVIGREGRSISIVDLCGVENEDCSTIDLGQKCIRSANGLKSPGQVQPLQQVTQYHYTVDKVTSKDSVHASSGDVHVLSFLCRICNEIIKCRGFYKADMVRHYAVEHNITNVNLVSHSHNGKIVWKVVEEPTCFAEASSQRCHKRKKSIHSLSELDQANKLLHLDAVNLAVHKDPEFITISDKPFLNSRKAVNDTDAIPVTNNLIGSNLFSTDVICID